MIFLHAAQVLLLLAVVAMVVERVRALAYRGNVDALPLRRGLSRLVREGKRDEAHALLLEAHPAWAARCASPLLDPAIEERARGIEVEERLMDLQFDATRWMRPLRASATIASAIGFIGAAAAIYWIFNVEHGLEALQAGAIENEGLSWAVLSIALGVSTSSLALGSWTLLKKTAVARITDARKLVSGLEDIIGTGAEDSREAVVDGE